MFLLGAPQVEQRRRAAINNSRNDVYLQRHSARVRRCRYVVAAVARGLDGLINNPCVTIESGSAGIGSLLEVNRFLAVHSVQLLRQPCLVFEGQRRRRSKFETRLS